MKRVKCASRAVLSTTICLSVLALALALYSSRNRELVQALSSLHLRLLTPLQTSVINANLALSNLVKDYLLLSYTSHENRALKQTNAALLAEISALEEMRLQNSRLQALWDTTGLTAPRKVLGRVVGRSLTPWNRQLIINVGSLHGVAIGNAVLAATGVVGQVLSVSNSASRLLLLSDRSSGIEATTLSRSARGIVQGAGEGEMVWKYIDLEDSVNIGERVISTGADQIYPNGITIGFVASVSRVKGELFKSVTLTPAVNPRTLEEVSVLVGLP